MRTVNGFGGALIFGSLVVLTAAGCGTGSSDTPVVGKATAALEGIYAVQEVTQNSAGCNAEGSSVLAERQQHFFAAKQVALGRGTVLRVSTCSSPESCRAGITADSPEAPEASLDLTDTRADGAATGVAYGPLSRGEGREDLPAHCLDREVTSGTLVPELDGAVRFEQRKSFPASYPLPVNGDSDSHAYCQNRVNDSTELEGSATAAPTYPCNSLEVWHAELLEPLVPTSP